MKSREKNILGRGISKYKDVEVRKSFVFLRYRKEVNVGKVRRR